MIIINNIKKYLSSIYSFFNELDLNCKFLSLLGIVLFFAISISIFNTNANSTDNLSTIRTSFSSIVGYFLQKASSKKKTILLGMLAIFIMLVILFSYIFDTPVNNPSLILFKNLFFSLMGYLTSAINKSNK